MTSLRRVQSCLIITHKMLFIFYIVLHVSNMAFGENTDEVKRIIKQDNYKIHLCRETDKFMEVISTTSMAKSSTIMEVVNTDVGPIFGSYMYDPIKQQFEASPYNENVDLKHTPTTTSTTTSTTTTTTTTTTPATTETDLTTSAEDDHRDLTSDATSITITTKRPTTTETTSHSEVTVDVLDTRTKALFRKKNLRARESSESSSPSAVSKRPKKHHRRHKA